MVFGGALYHALWDDMHGTREHLFIPEARPKRAPRQHVHTQSPQVWKHDLQMVCENRSMFRKDGIKVEMDETIGSPSVYWKCYVKRRKLIKKRTHDKRLEKRRLLYQNADFFL